jgi:tetratricopeptide (TPR) repeat protein
MKRLPWLLVLPLLFLVAPKTEAKDAWNRVESKNFILVGNAGVDGMKKVATKLEQFRLTLTVLFPGLKVDTPVPTRVYVFDNDDDFHPYKPLYKGKTQDDVAAFFLSTSELNYMALSTDGRFEDPLAPVFHEYEHFIIRQNLNNVPLWMNEGLAEFYSTFSPKEGGTKAVIGKPIGRHIGTLRNSPLIPLNKLFAVDGNSPYYNESGKAGIFYAESWALIHYLIFQDLTKKTHTLANFIQALSTDLTVYDAFLQVFQRDYASLEEELRQYISKFAFPVVDVSFDAAIEESKDMTSSKFTEAETEYLAGDLLIQLGKIEDAEKHLNKSITLDANSAPTHISLGTLRLRQKQYDAAKTEYLAAVVADPKNNLGHYYRGIFLVSERANDEAIAAFRRSIELQPSFAPAHVRLADLYVRLGQDNPAIQEYAKAIALDPHNLSARQSSTLALTRVGRGAIAGMMAKSYITLRGWDDQQSKYMLLVAVFRYRMARTDLPLLAPRAIGCRTDGLGHG